MGFKYAGRGCGLAAFLLVAGKAPLAAAPTMVAQNIDNGGTIFSRDSIYQNRVNDTGYAGGSLRREVEAAETNVSLSAAFMHIIASTYWQHFNYSGFKPQTIDTLFYYYEPLSTTTQFGASLGLGYSF